MIEILRICKLFTYQIEGSAFANVQTYIYTHATKKTFLPLRKVYTDPDARMHSAKVLSTRINKYQKV